MLNCTHAHTCVAHVRTKTCAFVVTSILFNAHLPFVVRRSSPRFPFGAQLKTHKFGCLDKAYFKVDGPDSMVSDKNRKSLWKSWAKYWNPCVGACARARASRRLR